MSGEQAHYLLLKSNGRYCIFTLKLSKEKGSEAEIEDDQRLFFAALERKASIVQVPNDPRAYSVIHYNSSYKELSENLNVDEEYIELQSKGGISKCVYKGTANGQVRTEKKSSQREHQEFMKLDWAVVPQIPFTYISKPLPDDELRSLSSVSTTIAELPTMEDYGSKDFLLQFSKLATMLPLRDGMDELLGLNPLVNVPSTLGDIGKLEDCTSILFSSEATWIASVYKPLLNLNNPEFGYTFSSFESLHYKMLFKERWLSVHKTISSTIAKIIKHPCPDILATYYDEHLQPKLKDYPIIKIKGQPQLGIPFFWAECKQNAHPEIVTGEHQLFLDTLFFARFMEELLQTAAIPALYTVLFYGSRCEFYKMEKNSGYHFVPLGGGPLQYIWVQKALSKVRTYAISLALVLEQKLRASASPSEDDTDDCDYILEEPAPKSFKLDTGSGLTEDKLALWNIICTLRERVPDASIRPDLLHIFG